MNNETLLETIFNILQGKPVATALAEEVKRRTDQVDYDTEEIVLDGGKTLLALVDFR